MTFASTEGQPTRDARAKDDQRIAIIPYGEVPEAVERFRQGGEETYFTQRFARDLVRIGVIRRKFCRGFGRASSARATSR